MKKQKEQSPVKAAKKTIQERLLKELTSITAQLKKDGINAIANIEKEAKKLAKKITKGAKVDEPAKAEPAKKVAAVAPDVKTPTKEASPAKKKPAPKTQEPKVKEVAAPVAVVEKPAAKVKAAKPAVQKKEEKK